MCPENRPVRFVLNGVLIEVEEIDPTISVLSWLREHQRHTGTKEGCAEGDCGACTVVVGELIDDVLQMRSVNACIQFMPMLDGKALFTVEYLRCGDGALHPTQRAMVECHGSQCGFCTPGFVMSLWNSYIDAELTEMQPDRRQLATALSGNLCRCTGYRTILDAAEKMFELPSVSFDRSGIEEQLRHLSCSQPLAFSYTGKKYFAPHDLQGLLKLRAENTDATLSAGCTDVGLWINKRLFEPSIIISVTNVVELKQISRTSNGLRIGAGVSLQDAYSAVAEYFPVLDQMWERFASPPIRHAGTLGGNVANGSPIGDSMPWLIALQAAVVLSNISGSRTIPLETLYIDYMKKSMHPDEIVEAIELPLPTSDLRFRTYKVAKRYDSDISAVCAAFALRLNDNVITEARVAFGGMAAIPCRALACEAALMGANWDEATAQAAMSALRHDFTPLDDMRASASYRSKVAANLLYRFYLESRTHEPLPDTQTSVFTELPVSL